MSIYSVAPLLAVALLLTLTAILLLILLSNYNSRGFSLSIPSIYYNLAN